MILVLAPESGIGKDHIASPNPTRRYTVEPDEVQENKVEETEAVESAEASEAEATEEASPGDQA